MSEHNPTELNNSNNEEPRIAGELGAILESQFCMNEETYVVILSLCFI